MRFYIGCCLALCSLAVQAQPVLPLSEQQVVSLFLEKNLHLIAGRVNINQAEADLIIAKQLTNPNLALSVSGLGSAQQWPRNSSYWDKPYNNNLTLNQLIETAGKRQLRIEGAQLALEAQSLLFEDLLLALKRDLLIDYYQVAKQQRLVEIYREILQKLNETSQANWLRLQVGDISETEFNRIQLAVLKAQTDVDEANLTLSLLKQQLASLLMFSIEPEQIITHTQFQLSDTRRLPALNKLIEQALQQRADVQSAQIVVEQQQKSVESAQKLVIPNVELGMQLVHDPAAVTKDSVGVGVSVSVPLWHQYQGEVQKARADKRQSEVSLLQLEQQVKAQVLQAYAQFQQKLRVLERFDQELIGRATQIRSASLVAYNQGAISLLELLDAENNYRGVMLDYTEAQFELTQAKLRLNYAIGNKGTL